MDQVIQDSQIYSQYCSQYSQIVDTYQSITYPTRNEEASTVDPLVHEDMGLFN